MGAGGKRAHPRWRARSFVLSSRDSQVRSARGARDARGTRLHTDHRHHGGSSAPTHDGVRGLLRVDRRYSAPTHDGVRGLLRGPLEFKFK